MGIENEAGSGSWVENSDKDGAGFAMNQVQDGTM